MAFTFVSILFPIKFKVDTKNVDQSLTSNHLFIESALKQPIQNEPPPYMNQNSQSRNGFHKNFVSPLYTTSHLLLLKPTNRTINRPLISFPPIMTISKLFILTILIIIINVCTALWLTWLPSSLLVPRPYSTQFNNYLFLFLRYLVVDVAALLFVGPSRLVFFID